MRGRSKSWKVCLTSVGLALGGLAGMLVLLSAVTVRASVGPPYVESSPTIQITTMAEPILPERFVLVAIAFTVPETGIPVTLTLHTTQFPTGAKLAYQAPDSTSWQRLPMHVDTLNREWRVTNAPTGKYAVITVTAAAALPGRAIIIDDLDPGFQPYGPEGNWHLVSGPDPTDYYLSHARWTSNTYSVMENWGVWQPATELDGAYEVYAFVPGNHADTTNGNYRIQHAGQESWQAVNQSTKWAEWVSLGVYTFTSGTESYVSLTDVTGEDNLEYMIARTYARRIWMVGDRSCWRK